MIPLSPTPTPIVTPLGTIAEDNADASANDAPSFVMILKDHKPAAHDSVEFAIEVTQTLPESSAEDEVESFEQALTVKSEDDPKEIVANARQAPEIDVSTKEAQRHNKTMSQDDGADLPQALGPVKVGDSNRQTFQNGDVQIRLPVATKAQPAEAKSDPVVVVKPTSHMQIDKSSAAPLSPLENAIAQTNSPPAQVSANDTHKPDSSKATATATATATSLQPVSIATSTLSKFKPDATIQSRESVAQNSTTIAQQPTSVAPPSTKFMTNPSPQNSRLQHNQVREGVSPKATPIPAKAIKAAKPFSPAQSTAEISQNLNAVQRPLSSPIEAIDGNTRTEAAIGHVDKTTAHAPVSQSVAFTAPTAEQARHVAQQLVQATPSQTPGTTEITLNPEELGRVRMSLTLLDGAMTLTIQADRPETTDLMRRHIDQLAQTYRQMGFTNMSFNFAGSAQGGSDQGTPQHDAVDDIPSEDIQVIAPDQPTQIHTTGRLDLRI